MTAKLSIILVIAQTVTLSVFARTKSLSPLSVLNQKCFSNNNVCTSQKGLGFTSTFEQDFINFENIVLASKDSFFTEAFSAPYFATTKTIFSLYSLCHAGSPECRKNAERCHCNIATKNYFETQAYLSFVKCRQTTSLARRKQQAAVFFSLSSDMEPKRTKCFIPPDHGYLRAMFPWLRYYFKSISSEKSKKEVLDYCKQKSVSSRKLYQSKTKPFKTGSPSSFCRRVGEVLKGFKFTQRTSKRQQLKEQLLGVGLIAYCGACECCGKKQTDSIAIPDAYKPYYNGLSSGCKICYQKMLTFKHPSIQHACGGCNCKDGTRQCGCVHCPKPYKTVSIPDTYKQYYNGLSSGCKICYQKMLNFKHSSIRNACSGCNCKDGTRQCGCFHCPEPRKRG